MNIRGIIFDINGTLVDIHTNEASDEIYRAISNFLSFQGINLSPDTVRTLYFQIMKDQRRLGAESYPEFDVVAVFREIIMRCRTDFTRLLPVSKIRQLPLFLAEMYRSLSRYRLQLYPGVKEVLTQLSPQYLMAAVSDGQSAWAMPELHSVGLSGYFEPVIVSGDLGFRKPDVRIFRLALDGLEMGSQEVLFVGNDMYRDIFGAQQLEIKTVFFRSNQGEQYREGVAADYIIYTFPELLNAIRFFEGK